MVLPSGVRVVVSFRATACMPRTPAGPGLAPAPFWGRACDPLRPREPLPLKVVSDGDVDEAVSGSVGVRGNELPVLVSRPSHLPCLSVEVEQGKGREEPRGSGLQHR